jgi:hypothetical protein
MLVILSSTRTGGTGAEGASTVATGRHLGECVSSALGLKEDAGCVPLLQQDGARVTHVERSFHHIEAHTIG